MSIVTLDISDEEDDLAMEVEFGLPREGGFGTNVQIISDSVTIEMSYSQAENLYKKFKPFFEVEEEEWDTSAKNEIAQVGESE